jgi:uncharacterized protein (TIGR00251 family)
VAWLVATRDGVVLSLHCQPGAKASRVVGLHDDRLKLQLQAPPLENRANEALVAWLADQLSLPRKEIEILTGHTGRQKRVLARGVTLERVERLLTTAQK